jgi:AcrR family transcriptional regulator
MRRIAAAVGVSPTALYMHFADKDAILATIAQDTFAELLDRLDEVQSHQAPPIERFRAGLRAYIAFGLERPDEYRLTFMTQYLSLSKAKGCRLPLAERSFAMLQDRVVELMRHGQFRPGDSAQVAELIWAALHGVTSLLLDQPANLQTPPDALIDSALDLLQAGLITPEAEWRRE